MNQEKPIRILMLLENESFPDDCRVYLEATSLREAGYSVTVISPTGRTKAKAENVEGVYAYRYPRPWEISGFIGYVMEYAYSMFMMFWLAWFVFFRRGFDVIHVHTPPDMTALIAILFKVFGKRFVFDLHDLSPELFQAQREGEGSQLVTRVLRGFERIACRSADRLIATNQTQQNVQIERCGANPKHCYIVRNGPNAMFLGNVQPRAELAHEERLVIGYVGVIGIQDGVDYMLRALNILKSEKGREDFLAVIIGAGPALKHLQQLVTEFELEKQVIFTGMIPFADVPAYIASFDLAITPDPSNPYNDSCTTIKTMEYMALGKPTVCFETRENINTAGEAALYAENNDIQALAAKMELLMDTPELRQKLGEIGRQRVVNGLTWDHQAAQLIALYDNLFSVERSPAASQPDFVGQTTVSENHLVPEATK